MKRSYLLSDVSILARSLDYNVFLDYTCERAKIFYDHHLKPLWDDYLLQSLQADNPDDYLKSRFPFKAFIQSYLQIE
jgi:hypothetical protein